MSERPIDLQQTELLRARVQKDPGCPEFVELAGLLIEDDATRAEGRETLLAGLNGNPRHAQARLLLARSYYLDGYSSFCARELQELRGYAESPALDRLLHVFRDYLPAGVNLPSHNLGGSQESFAKLVEPPDDRSPKPTRIPSETNRPQGKSMEEIVGELDLDADFDELEVELSED